MITVYTVITGKYDTLQDTIWPSTCLTDKKQAPVKGWTQVVFKPEPADNLRRASRKPKMMPRLYFNSEYTLYMDGNVRLISDPRALVKKYLKHHDMALFPHPERNSIYQEAERLIQLRHKADPEKVKRQIAYYKKVGFPRRFGLTACWVILRRNTHEVQRLGKEWWKIYNQFTCRDQLSFDFVRWLTSMKYCSLPGNLFKKTSKHFRRRKHQ